jgi:inner membrane protease ATP23
MGSDAPDSNSSLQNSPDAVKDTGFYPGNDSFSRWRNIFNILSGQMTEEGKELYRETTHIRNEKRDCKRCEDMRDFLFQYSQFSIEPLF